MSVKPERTDKSTTPIETDGLGDSAVLERIQNRVLWLSIQIIHHANFVREKSDREKVGGHQSSSASMVSLMTALYFDALRPGDLVAVKPHASPVFHSIQFLLGNLPSEKLRELRGFQGLQAYPSRTKDTDSVDFSTGSVGLGAVMPNFAALAGRYVEDHFGIDRPHRFFALLGDAELDEGNVWEALGEDNFRGLGQTVWVIDLNRQSLDRVVPSGKSQRIQEIFRAHDWHVIELKYGRKLQEYFSRPAGEKLHLRIDSMSNEEYQSLLRLDDGDKIRESLAQVDGALDAELLELLETCPDSDMSSLLADLGGHDLDMIREAYKVAGEITGRPVVIVAYTIKGWRLPIAGDPLNHSKLLTQPQMDELRQKLGVTEGEEFGGFAPESQEGRHIEARKRAFESKLSARRSPSIVPSAIPKSLDSVYKSLKSSQQVLGTILTALARLPEVASRIVTASPDVSISTNLGGWINKMGVYSLEEKTNYFRQNNIPQLVNWKQGPGGHQIELGISENNLFLLLSALGLSSELFGEVLLPVGTLYDTFIPRGLDALTYGVYSESKFIFAGTPSGVSLSREGGAHQSFITPSIGMEMPNLVSYEPCFGQEVEWILLASLRNLLDRLHGRSVYLRLSTVPVDQSLFGEQVPVDDAELLRQDVLRGGYRIVDYRKRPEYKTEVNVANIFSCGVMTPVAIEASKRLVQQGMHANVVNVTSPDLLYRGWKDVRRVRAKRMGTRSSCHLERLIPDQERKCPIITVVDGHSHTLAFLGSVFGTRTVPLGVDEFGQTGSREQLYEHYGISASSIVEAVESVLGARDV